MGIKRFFLALFICAILFLGYQKEVKVNTTSNKNEPMVSFENSTMYDISKDSVFQMVKSSKANIFKQKEELYDGTIIYRDKENNTVQNINANYMRKNGNSLYLKDNVFLYSENDTTLKTDELSYNLQTKIAKNNSPFVLSKNNSTFEGTKLYYEFLNNYLKADETHFKIDLKDNDL